MRSGKLVIAEGGGPSAVINRAQGRGRGGGDCFEVGPGFGRKVDEILVHDARAPRSARHRTRDRPDLAYCRNILASLKAHGASWLGGNDTADTVRIVSEEAAKESYDLRSIHIPKTIDNDLMEKDHAPGFRSAARFVAQAFMGADLDNRSLPGIYLAVVMGRNAGFLTAVSAAARTVEGDVPARAHLRRNQIPVRGQVGP